MPAYDRCTYEFVLDFRRPTINKLQVVSGDTANTFVITLKDKGNAVTLDADLHKVVAVFTRADGQIYTQDAGTGVSFTTSGVVTIDVYSSSFRTGVNNVKIQLYKRVNSSATVYPLLLTTYEQRFQGRSQAIPESGAPNAPSQLPMLEGLIDDARDAISDCEEATEACEEATEAAQTVTETVQGMLDNIDSTPTQNSNNLVKSGGVYQFVWDTAQYAAEEVRDQIPEGATSATADKPKMDGTASSGVSVKWARSDHVHPHDSSKQDVLTFDTYPRMNSQNPVTSQGIAMSAKLTAQRNVYYVAHDTETWGSGTILQAFTEDKECDLAVIAEDAVFVTSVTIPSGQTVVLFEVMRQNDMVYLQSEELSNGKYVTADFGIDEERDDYAQLDFRLHDVETPLHLHVDSTEEVTTSGHTYRVVNFASGETDKIYSYRNTRDMYVELPVWNPGAGQTMTACLHKERVITDTSNTTVIEFTCFNPKYSGSDAEVTLAGVEGYKIAAFYANGVFDNAVATYFNKTF